MCVILQTDDLLMVGEVELRMAKKANDDSQRSSRCNGSQGINSRFSCMALLTPGKSLNGVYDALIYP